MRRVLSNVAASLDGYIAGPNANLTGLPLLTLLLIILHNFANIMEYVP